MLQRVVLRPPFTPAGGHAYNTPIPAEMLPKLAAGGMAVVAEDGKALGPAGALHQHIREHGGGAFSIWGAHVYLSASDNSDCNTNGRAYSLEVIDLGDPSLRDELARNDALLLDLVDRNRNHNNSVTGNFLGYFRVLSGHLRHHGIPMPRRALEIGAGRRPYTALRFLAEGVELFAANDVQRIERTLPGPFVAQLIGLLDLVDGSSADRLRSLLESAPGGDLQVRGLEILDERPFETLQGPRDLDLVFSTSVLEHVDKPREVVARMFDLLRPGGHAWHSIDLRDHSDFARPLEFLRMTADQYAAIGTENRLRASDWEALFAEAGFECLDRKFSTIAVGTREAGNRVLVHSSRPPDRPWVDAAMRATFQPPFATRDLVDLSILGTTFLCRKP
ncbi:MAG TPA: methyltransferase domain-containing protein [Planctomycetota bacterium]|nr:methyltransferase domain-containing protein [Planctomycetota bacterium]